MNRKIVFSIIFLFLIFFALNLSAEEKNNTDQTKKDLTEKEDKKEINSLEKERRDTLRYGISSEISEVLDALKKEKNNHLNSEVITLFNQNIQEEVKIKALQLFSELKDSSLKEQSLQILKQSEENEIGGDLLRAVLDYLEAIEAKDSAGAVYEMVTHNNNAVARKAILVLAEIGSDAEAEKLKKNFQDPDFNDQLKEYIILFWGETQYAGAEEILLEILDDETEKNVWRQYAAEALGRLQAEKALPKLEKLSKDADPLMRAYAFSALAYFISEKAFTMLLQGLRDDHWRVRSTAIKAIGKAKRAEAVDVLIYKAKNDPEQKIKLEAVQALSSIGNEKALGFLQEYLQKKYNPLTVRQTVCNQLINDHLEQSIPVLEKIIEKEWKEKEPQLLLQIANQLSAEKNPNLERVFLRLLNHEDYLARLAAIKGIKHNHFIALKGRLEELQKTNQPLIIKKALKSCLESL